MTFWRRCRPRDGISGTGHCLLSGPAFVAASWAAKGASPFHWRFHALSCDTCRCGQQGVGRWKVAVLRGITSGWQALIPFLFSARGPGPGEPNGKRWMVLRDQRRGDPIGNGEAPGGGGHNPSRTRRTAGLDKTVSANQVYINDDPDAGIRYQIDDTYHRFFQITKVIQIIWAGIANP